MLTMKVMDYARLMGLHPESVRRAIRNGDIPAMQLGREWHIDDEFAEAAIQRETRFARTEESAYLIKRRLQTKRSRSLAELQSKLRMAVEEIETIRDHARVDNITYIEEEERILHMLYSSGGIASILNKIERLNLSIEEMQEIIEEVEVKGGIAKLANPFKGGKNHERY